MKRAATVVSRLFEPFLLQFFLILFTAFRAGIIGWNLVYTMAAIVIVVFIPPIVLLAWAIRTKKISNWDISDRKERVKALGTSLFLCVIDIVMIILLNNGEMTRLFLFFFIMIIGFFCITLFWKVSGHLSTATIFLCLMLQWYGWEWWPILFFLPVLAWSRVVLKRHTLTQTIGGIIYGGMMYEIWQRFFG